LSLFVCLASIDLCWINFIEKICFEPILDAVNEEGIKTHYFLKMQERNAKLQADNQRIYKQEWSVTTC
jgi:hypothetical protein